MHTSGLVLTWEEAGHRCVAARARLQAAGPFTLGVQQGSKQAVVLETADPRASQDWHEWALALPGVASLEVVFVAWEAPEEENHE